MYARLLDVFHHATNKGSAHAVADAVHIAFNRVIQKTVQQHGRVMTDLDRLAHIALQVTLLVHDFHGTATEHVARANDQRVTQSRGFLQRFWLCSGRGIGRLL